jgi:hypothetical protein
MVVLETATPVSAVGLIDPLDSYNSRSSMKLLPKRFINVHQWLGPICAKQLKETLVSSVVPRSYKSKRVMRIDAACGRSMLHVASGVYVCAEKLVIRSGFFAYSYGDRSETKHYLKTLLEDIVLFA